MRRRDFLKSIGVAGLGVMIPGGSKGMDKVIRRIDLNQEEEFTEEETMLLHGHLLGLRGPELYRTLSQLSWGPMVNNRAQAQALINLGNSDLLVAFVTISNGSGPDQWTAPLDGSREPPDFLQMPTATETAETIEIRIQKQKVVPSLDEEVTPHYIYIDEVESLKRHEEALEWMGLDRLRYDKFPG